MNIFRIGYDSIKYILGYWFFLKSTIYYTGNDSSPCLQKELYMKYQYPKLFIQLSNIKNY